MEVDVKVGGSTYHQSLSPSGGTFSFMHQGAAFSFNIDCSRPEVVCPSEVWPAQVAVDQRDPMYQYRMWVKIPTQSCSGQTVAPKASECGAGTTNCDSVCRDTQTDLANCGMCGQVCGTGLACAAGACGFTCTGKAVSGNR